METTKRFLRGRIGKGKIRDCHGDMHSGNIFITDKICIFDAIEFNDRFRYSDVASDVAFLAMDLDFQQRPDLAELPYRKIPCVLERPRFDKGASILQMLQGICPWQSNQLQT